MMVTEAMLQMLKWTESCHLSYLQKAADSSVAFCNHITALREAHINQNTIQNTSNKELSSEATARTHQLTVTYLII